MPEPGFSRGEAVYHAPEGWDSGALKVLVQSGRLSNASLATMLLRKIDWHDYESITWLLEHGADPNLLTHWGKTALHNAALRDNALEIFEVLLDHGADPANPRFAPGGFPIGCGHVGGSSGCPPRVWW